MRYWKCNKDLSDKINELWKEERKVVEQMRELSASVGGDPRKVVVHRSFGTLHMTGFVFEKHPGKGWYKRSAEGDAVFYAPRSNSEIGKKQAALQGLFLEKLAKLIGMTDLFDYPGVNGMGKTVYLTTKDDFVPIVGMERISDIEFEKVAKSETDN